MILSYFAPGRFEEQDELQQDDLRNRMKSSFSSYHPSAKHPILHIALVQNSQGGMALNQSILPPNSSDDLCLLFCINSSSMFPCSLPRRFRGSSTVIVQNKSPQCSLSYSFPTGEICEISSAANFSTHGPMLDLPVGSLYTVSTNSDKCPNIFGGSVSNSYIQKHHQ